MFGEEQEQHDQRLLVVMERLKNAGVTHNDHKYEFSKSRIRFLDHVVSSEVIAADPEKLSVIAHIPAPKVVSGVRRFLGAFNKLIEFMPNFPW